MDTKRRYKNNATTPKEKSFCTADKLHPDKAIQNFTGPTAGDNKNMRQHDEEILKTLQAINVHLASLQARPNDQVNEQESRTMKDNESQNICAQSDSLQLTQDLERVFSSLLHYQQNQSGKISPPRTATTNNTESNQLPEYASKNRQHFADSSNQPVNASFVQMSSQELAQAQYELANELDASMQKLRQVISESEKIADRINRLLGASENSKQQ